MASLIPGYEYDIFISYRQKDNKHDGWVTEFVDNLKGELESTFKEEISVYFDINSHDGLLETHDVEASLKNKLKCLVFIPVISRTYCDPKSFAWENEFKAFVEQATHDQFGLKVKLTNGNVACRVLPVRIHDLDPADTMLYEDMVCGMLRGIEFVYEEPGVNRPLTPDDDEKKNQKKTRYRNQINKVALAVSEIFQGLETEPEWEKFETRIAEEDFRHTEELLEKETSIERKVFLKNKSNKGTFVKPNPDMKELEEEELEKFIRENKDKFNEHEPELAHSQHFLNKLLNKFKEVINIVPYLVKVGIATIFIFILSFLIWRAYICPPLTRISYKYWKAEHDYRFQIRRSTRLAHTYIINSEEKAKFDNELQKFDDSYKILSKQLRKNPSEDNIAQMLRFYQDKLLRLEDINQNYTNKNTQSK